MRAAWNGLKLNIKFTLVISLLVALPISVLAVVLFRNMEKNAVDDNKNYMQYTMERNQDNILKNIDSINMTTQFFLNDEALVQMLAGTARREQMTTEELVAFYHSDIASLERLVNNNTLLYGVRVYAVNDDVQEMMPILYNHSRMKRMGWAFGTDYTGWHYNYQDNLFDNRGSGSIASLVTKIEDYENGLIGVLETAVAMEDMFPALYENIEDEWSCFVSDAGGICYGDEMQEAADEFVRPMLREGFASGGIETDYIRQGGKHLVVSGLYIREMQGTLLSVKDISGNVCYVRRMRNSFGIVMLVLIVGLAFLINYIVKRLLRHFYEIMRSIHEIEKGDLGVRIKNCGSDEVGELGVQLNRMLDHIEQLMKENIDREILAKNSQIRALQNQINAHFIYNVLESIKMMAEIDEEYTISDAITSLGRLLRYSIRWVSGNVRVEEEIEYIRDYILLINLRFDYEIYLSLNLPDEVLGQEIPKMSLQPIVENAVYHGIEDLAEDTNIYIKGMVQDGNCMIEVTDAGKGMSEEELQRLRRKMESEIEPDGGKGNGIGLKNVRDRIRMSFGEAYGIDIASRQGCYTKVTIRVPMRYREKGEG